MKTVILDDDAELTFLMSKKLTAAGIDHTIYLDEKKFLKDLTNDIYVVVIDHHLKTNLLTGLDIYKILKKKNQANFIIGWSGVTDPRILREYINSGIDGFVDKDHDPHFDELVKVINDGITEAKRRRSFFSYIESKMPGGPAGWHE